MSLVAISQHVFQTPHAANARAEFVEAAAQRAMVLNTNLLEASSLVASSKAERPRAGSDCASSPTASATAFSTRRLRCKTLPHGRGDAVGAPQSCLVVLVTDDRQGKGRRRPPVAVPGRFQEQGQSLRSC